jgi:hypothetical protein
MNSAAQASGRMEMTERSRITASKTSPIMATERWVGTPAPDSSSVARQMV